MTLASFSVDGQSEHFSVPFSVAASVSLIKVNGCPELCIIQNAG